MKQSYGERLAAADRATQADNPWYYITRRSGCVNGARRRGNRKWRRQPWNAVTLQQLHSPRPLVPLRPSAPHPPLLPRLFPLTIFVCKYPCTFLTTCCFSLAIKRTQKRTCCKACLQRNAEHYFFQAGLYLIQVLQHESTARFVAINLSW
jgi:hypothetical protein